MNGPDSLGRYVVAAVLLASACNEPTTTPPVLSRLELQHPWRVLAVKEQTSVSVRAFDAGNRFMNAPHLTWSSSDTSIATVDRFGMVTGLRIGPVAITASSGDVESSIGLSVRAAYIRVSLQSGPQDLLVGDTAVLRGEFLDLHGEPIATDLPLHWQSSEHTTLVLQQAPGLSGQQVKVTARSIGLARVLAFADDVEGVYIAPVVSAAASTPPLEVSDFHLLAFTTLDDFPALTPSIRLRVVPGHEVNLLRVEVAVASTRPQFPALCSATSLPPGEYEVLGLGSYPGGLIFASPFWTRPDQMAGVVLLTYRDGTGGLTSIARRGSGTLWDGRLNNPKVPWQLCT